MKPRAGELEAVRRIDRMKGGHALAKRDIRVSADAFGIRIHLMTHVRDLSREEATALVNELRAAIRRYGKLL